MNVILQGVVGSTAYGLATPESNIDRLGVFLSPLRKVISLNPGKDTIVVHEPSDIAHHEVGKFIKLCLANNPTVMELLWLPEYEVCTDVGQRLINHREIFLSQRVRKTYGGYAVQQLERLKRREEAEPGAGFAADLKKRTEKHGRHCYRLIIQGMNVLREGELRVRLTPDEVRQSREAGLMAANNVEEFERMVRALMEEFDATPSDLPEGGDEEDANRLLVSIRLQEVETPVSESDRWHYEG